MSEPLQRPSLMRDYAHVPGTSCPSITMCCCLRPRRDHQAFCPTAEDPGIVRGLDRRHPNGRCHDLQACLRVVKRTSHSLFHNLSSVRMDFEHACEFELVSKILSLKPEL